MLTSQFDYNLPRALIAQKPTKPRDRARLLILDKKTGRLAHRHFYNLIDYLEKGDVLVLNNSKVIPARLIGQKETGGKVEIFLLNKITPPPARLASESVAGRQPSPCKGEGDRKKANFSSPFTRGRPGGGKSWLCLIKGKIKIGQKIFLPARIATPARKAALSAAGGQSVAGGPKKIVAEIIACQDNGGQKIWQIKFNAPDKKILAIGQTPTPPYIKQKAKLQDYQTIYAKERGSVAAPTAGLHFTKKLLTTLKKRGIKIEYITLHVGLGTFAPVKTKRVEDHQIHRELAIIDQKTAARINQAKQAGHKIIACGTTTVRTLEAFANQSGQIIPQQKWVDIFIYPGYRFKIVNKIITNFHLPKSTLLMLVSAFAQAPADKSALASRKNIMRVYREAIGKKYKFYSFGDAMLIK